MISKHIILLATFVSSVVCAFNQGHHYKDMTEREVDSLAEGLWYTIAEINTDQSLGNISCQRKNSVNDTDGNERTIGYFKRDGVIHNTDEPEYNEKANKNIKLLHVVTYNQGHEAIYTYTIDDINMATLQSRSLKVSDETLNIFSNIAANMSVPVKYIDHTDCEGLVGN